MPDPTEQTRWYARVHFVGTLTDDQMTELCHPQTGPAKSGLFEPGKVSLRFVLDGVPNYMEAQAALRELLLTRPLLDLVANWVLRGPVAVELMDEQRRDEQINEQFGLPADTPPDETGRILLDRIAKLPAATDADRARWRAPQDGDKGTCATCKGGIWYQDCPTGGWWIHDQHPADNHDAVGDESSKQPGCTCWSTNDKHSLSCRLSRGVPSV